MLITGVKYIRVHLGSCAFNYHEALNPENKKCFNWPFMGFMQPLKLNLIEHLQWRIILCSTRTCTDKLLAAGTAYFLLGD